jgi:uncharacterized protein (TIGR03083 family)
MIDSRPFFRPLAEEFLTILRELPPDAWNRPTAAGSWTVRDVLAHLVDGTMRRLSFDRDRLTPPTPGRTISGERDFVAFINELNAEWISIARRFSPRVLRDLYASTSRDLADFVERVPLEAPALFGVSWAGEAESQAWFDIGREFTEHWHHQAQIRDAVDAPAPSNPEWLRVVLAVAVRGLPHAYRDVPGTSGDTIGLEVTGASGGAWTLRHEDGRWRVAEGDAAAGSAARVVMSDDTAWRLLFNGLAPAEARARVALTGPDALTAPLLRARSVIV